MSMLSNHLRQQKEAAFQVFTFFYLQRKMASFYPQLAYFTHLPKYFVFLPDLLVHRGQSIVLSYSWEI